MQMVNVEVNEMPKISGSNNAVPRKNAQKELPTAKKIQVWLVSHLAERLEINSNQIDVTIPFERYGLDSLAAVSLTGDLEEWLGCELDPTLLYDYPTVKALTQHLVEEFVVKE